MIDMLRPLRTPMSGMAHHGCSEHHRESRIDRADDPKPHRDLWPLAE
jgi:hypothetical protein